MSMSTCVQGWQEGVQGSHHSSQVLLRSNLYLRKVYHSIHHHDVVHSHLKLLANCKF